MAGTADSLAQAAAKGASQGEGTGATVLAYGGGGFWWGWDGVEDDLLGDVEAGAAQELVNDLACEAGGVVFDAHGFFGFVEFDQAHAVDLAQAGHCKSC